MNLEPPRPPRSFAAFREMPGQGHILLEPAVLPGPPNGPLMKPYGPSWRVFRVFKRVVSASKYMINYEGMAPCSTPFRE